MQVLFFVRYCFKFQQALINHYRAPEAGFRRQDNKQLTRNDEPGLADYFVIVQQCFVHILP